MMQTQAPLKVFTYSLFLISYFLIPAQAQRHWQQELQYDINVRLNDAEHSLDGFLKLQYQNNSPDTLRFIWFHTWPNAYKNDRTAFSDQLLENGRTDFYFADAKQRGYMNRLDFRVNDQRAETEDHPQHIDIIKVILPSPLPPNASAVISTPFHVQLPYTFSRSGFDGKAYQVTQWYPKPAVYDHQGWHEMPYLDQGEFYAEFGTYDVRITLPDDYIVAATGICANEADALHAPAPPQLAVNAREKKTGAAPTKKNSPTIKAPMGKTETPRPTKTLIYHQDSIHDFAFFADKRFIVSIDSMQLEDGRQVHTRVFSLPQKKYAWTNAGAYLKNAIRFHSQTKGIYPYDIVSIVEGKQGFEGGMEYPTITILNAKDDGGLEPLIIHEVGHNWHQGILGTNERKSPWMDEGLNSYYDRRYPEHLAMRSMQGGPKVQNQWRKALDAGRGSAVDSTKASPTTHPTIPQSAGSLEWLTLSSLHLDQPIRMPSDSFDKFNYSAIAYSKAADWFGAMEKLLGRERFDSCIKAYYTQWKFKHPQEEDLLNIFRQAGGGEVAQLIHKLDATGPLENVQRKGIRIKAFGSIDHTDRTHNLFIAPVPGYNIYDGFMLGALLHNYTIPLARFRYAVAPMYAFRSKSLNGIANINYSIYPKKKIHELRFIFDAAKFTMDDYWPENAPRIHQSFTKFSPGIKLEWKNKDPRSTVIKTAMFKSFFIAEDELRFARDTINDVDIVSKAKSAYSIHQLTLSWENYRALYPWKMELRAEAGDGFGRFSATGNYFFNFRKKGGVALRAFAGKFVYFGDETIDKVFSTDRFHLNMSGPKGYEDYTYSNYFLGRNAYEGFPSQQIMIRDGAFKVRTDLLGQKIGKTDNWLMSINAVMDVPDKLNILNVLPVKIPLKIFADVGTYAEAWDEDNQGARVLFDAGLQFSFLKNTVHLYVPLVYSKVYRDYFKSTPGNGFLQRMSFSADIHLFNPRKVLQQELK